MSLKEIHSRAEQLRKQFDRDYHPASLQAALSAYTEAGSLVARLSLFSTNEGLEDVSSTDLQYVLVDYHIGVLTFQINDRDRRQKTLQDAEAAFVAFLTRCEDYGLVSEEDRADVKSLLGRESGEQTERKVSPADMRDRRIARYKREKALQSKIDTAQSQSNGDEELLRRLHIASIHLAVSKALQELEGITRELELLKTMPTELRTRESGENDTGAADRATWRLDRTNDQPLMDNKGRPLRPFVITSGDSTRDRMRNEVFRPDHSLPTMSIDEYLEIERQRGGILPPQNGQQPQTRPPHELRSARAADAAEEEERQKAIAWDHFTENNPRGIGNTMNRG